jgi:hypothetical protein
VGEVEKKLDVKAISLDGIDTTAAWTVEVEEPVIETALDWLEDSDDEGVGSRYSKGYSVSHRVCECTTSRAAVIVRGR